MTLTSGRRLFLVALATLVFRFWLAAALPLSGDEAYFYWWGKFPDWGFYDHPPMIGWWLAALVAFDESEWWLRLPQIIQPLLLALAARALWPRLFPERQELRDAAALIVLLSPLYVWNVFITTDTALVYAAVLSACAWLIAVRAEVQGAPGVMRWYLLAGLLLAAATLAKYFAALLGFAYLVDALARRSRLSLIGLAVAFLCCLPALALMIWWNSGHCWTNYLFNFVNRHDAANTGFNLRTPLLYLLTLFYALTPPVIWALIRKSTCRAASAEFIVEKSLARISGIPLALFALLSFFKTIGLHWILAFLPFAALAAARRLSTQGVAKLIGFLGAFAALHVALIATLLTLPLETWRTTSLYPGLLLTFDSRAVVERAQPGATLLASDGYSNAALLGYNLRRYVPVLGPGSGHARHDDILTDWRRFAGRDITVLRKSEPRPGEYDAWFGEVAIDSFEYRGARFWVVRGRAFDYERYRATVLDQVRHQYYAVPSWLPLTACYFCERYFPETPCRR